MSKWKIDNLYNDGNKIFANNTNITSDLDMAFLTPYLATLDLVAEFNGGRYFFTRYLNSNNDYDLSKIQRGAWATLKVNIERYKRLITIDEMEYTLDDEYEISKQYGEAETETNTDAHTDTTSYGDDTNTMTTAPTTTTTTDNVTTFDSATERETGTTTTGTIQTIDTTKREKENDSITYGIQKETITEKTHTDTESGHKSSPQDFISKERAIANYNTLEMIAKDVINFVSYPIY